MNDLAPKINDELIEYQVQRLQNLITEIIECCEDRKLFESKKFSLPYAELRCLMLFRGERYLTVKGISQKMDVAKSRVTKLADGLIKKGLLEEIGDPRDGRVKLFSLSVKGEEAVEQIDAFQKELHRQILLQMDSEERKRVLSYLETLRAAMEAVKKRLA